MTIVDPEALKLEAEYDLVIVGSGGGSMAAALVAIEAGLSPVILEKRSVVGGSTGFSGGVWWVPDNDVIKRNGVKDSPELGRRYLDEVVTFQGKGTTRARRDAFLQKGPEMVRFLEREGMRFYHADGWADYYDERPGGQPRGRSIMAEPFDLSRLKGWKDRLSLYLPARSLPLGSDQLVQMMLFRRTWKARRILARMGIKMIVNKLTGRQVVASGGSIQGRMMEMALNKGVPIFTDAAIADFIVADDRVVGVSGTRDGKLIEVRARYGVLLNSGGFSRNEEMRQRYGRAPTSSTWTNANPGDTGEMIEAARALGADTENLDAAWWVPTSLNPDGSLPAKAIGADGTSLPFMHNTDFACPHMIIVDGDGQRYFNEAASYVEIGETMYERHHMTGKAIPSYAILDHRHFDRYPWGAVMPGTKPVQDWLASGFLTRAHSIDELARSRGIDPASLIATVTRFNGFARSGVDEDFQKGARAYDRWRADATVKPNPCLGEISEGPFYSIPIFPADVGTSGGLVTDERASVLREDGSVIAGLYATGNCTSSVMGRSYPGAGASIAASFTFGYIAAQHIAARATNRAIEVAA